MFLFNTAFTSQFNLDRRSTATVNGMGRTCRPARRTANSAAQYHRCVAHFTPDEIARARAVIREMSLGAPRVLEAVPATPLNSNVALAQLD
jgi:hypothetical protein